MGRLMKHCPFLRSTTKDTAQWAEVDFMVSLGQPPTPYPTFDYTEWADDR